MSRPTNSDLKTELITSTLMSFVVSFIFWIGQAVLGLGVPYWVCLLIAFLVCFLGVFIWVNTDHSSSGGGGGSWLDDL